MRAAVDEGLFGPGSVTWRIHGDPSLAVGGARSLLLQACHPLAMAGFSASTVYRQDPWGRLERTGRWIATTTWGTTAEARAAGARLRRLHARLPGGFEPETGRAYRVDDPDLLLWVHVTEVESLLDTYRRSGGRLEPGEGDRYVDEMRAVARLVGLDLRRVPRTEAQIAAYYERVRPELRVTALARSQVLFGLVAPMPRWVELATPARPAWWSLVATAAGLLPGWARSLYGLPTLPGQAISAALAARAIRSTLLLVPERLRASPEHKAALERLAA